MAVVNVYENVDEQAEWVLDRAGRRYIVHWVVETDDDLDDAVTVLFAPGLPRLFDFYRSGHGADALARVVKQRPRRRPDTTNIWDVEIEYDTKWTNQSDPNPMNRPPQVRWSTVRTTRIFVFDAQGNAVVNSARDDFDPPAEIDALNYSLQITRNEQNFNTGLAAQYINSVNGDTFFGFAPGQAKVQDINAELVFEGQDAFWKVSYEIHFRPNIPNPPAKLIDPDGNDIVSGLQGWDVPLLDQGLYEIRTDPATGKLASLRILDDKGKPAVQARRLDGHAQHLDFTAPRSQSFFIVFKAYPVRQFSGLNLP